MTHQPPSTGGAPKSRCSGAFYLSSLLGEGNSQRPPVRLARFRHGWLAVPFGVRVRWESAAGSSDGAILLR